MTLMTISLKAVSGAARQHRAARTLARPIGTLGGVMLATRLVIVRSAHDIEQLVHLRVIAGFRAIDRLLRKVIAQHVAWIGRIHAGATAVAWHRLRPRT